MIIRGSDMGIVAEAIIEISTPLGTWNIGGNCCMLELEDVIIVKVIMVFPL